MFRLEKDFPPARVTEESEQLPILEVDVPPVVKDRICKKEGPDLLMSWGNVSLLETDLL